MVVVDVNVQLNEGEFLGDADIDDGTDHKDDSEREHSLSNSLSLTPD